MLKHLCACILILNHLAAAASTPLCELVAFGRSEQSLAKRSRVQALAARVPASWSSALASRSPAYRANRIAALRLEIAEMVPPEAALKMAALRQSSQLGLVWDFPILNSAAAAAHKKRDLSEPDPIGAAVNLGYAQESAWLRHLGVVAAKLEELLRLQEMNGEGLAPTRERQKTRLSLAVLYAFSYGFEPSIKTGSRDAPSGGDAHLGGTYFEAAFAHFQHVAQTMKADPESTPDQKLLVNYMLGKHALNGIRAYSNIGRSDGGVPLAPFPAAFTFLDITRRTLREVARNLELRVRAVSSFSRWHEIFFETNNFLIEAHHWNARLRIDPDLEVAGNQMCFFEKRRLFIDLLLAAPADWVQSQLALNEDNLIASLINDLRWGYQLIFPASSGRDLFWDFEKNRSTLKYADFIQRLVVEGRFNELRARLN